MSGASAALKQFGVFPLSEDWRCSRGDEGLLLGQFHNPDPIASPDWRCRCGDRTMVLFFIFFDLCSPIITRHTPLLQVAYFLRRSQKDVPSRSRDLVSIESTYMLPLRRKSLGNVKPAGFPGNNRAL